MDSGNEPAEQNGNAHVLDDYMRAPPQMAAFLSGRFAAIGRQPPPARAFYLEVGDPPGIALESSLRASGSSPIVETALQPGRPPAIPLHSLPPDLAVLFRLEHQLRRLAADSGIRRPARARVDSLWSGGIPLVWVRVSS